MSNNLFRIVPLRRGREGQGLSYYAAMQVSTGLYMTYGGSFSEADIYDPMTRHANSEDEAISYAQTLGYSLDTQSQLLVRESTDGTKLSQIENRLKGAFFHIQGELVAHGGSTGEGVLTFFIPADVNFVGLQHLPLTGWVLCEEKPNSRALTGRVWIADARWPQNMASLH